MCQIDTFRILHILCKITYEIHGIPASVETIINPNTPDQEVKLNKWRLLIQQEEVWELQVCNKHKMIPKITIAKRRRNLRHCIDRNLNNKLHREQLS